MLELASGSGDRSLNSSRRRPIPETGHGRPVEKGAFTEERTRPQGSGPYATVGASALLHALRRAVRGCARARVLELRARRGALVRARPAPRRGRRFPRRDERPANQRGKRGRGAPARGPPGAGG